MRRQLAASMVLGLAMAWTGTAVAQQTAEERFQAGLYQEEVQGNLQQAIAIYEVILKDYAANRAVAAKAQLHIGMCYETLGLQEALRAYQRVIENFGEQSDAVSQARQHLAALRSVVASGGATAARLLLSSRNPADGVIVHPRVIVPSPDGRRVAYTQWGQVDGGVYVRDLASGEVQRVAAGQPTANNWSVVWSADGKRLAYMRLDGAANVGAITILDLASRRTEVVPGPDAQDLYLLDWSRDGRYLLCHRGKFALEVVTVADGTTQTLSDSAWVGQRASFSPDGRFVAFAAGPYGSETLFTAPVAGGPRRRIASAQGGVYLHPLWSPDGRAIAYQQPDGIWVVPVTGGAAGGSPRLAHRTFTAGWPVAWTNAGYYLTHTIQDDFYYGVGVDPATGEVGSEAPKELPAPRPSGGPYDFAWSPDMQHLAFTGSGNTVEVYSADSRSWTSYDVGSPAQRFEPTWSQNGREVFFNSDRGSQLAAVDVRTGRVRELFPPMRGNGFTLNAAGSRMAFVRRGADSASIEVVVAATGERDGRVVAAVGASGWNWRAYPRLSPQGDRVLYVDHVRSGTSDANSVLSVVASDGSGARRLASAPTITSAAWDPSGQFIAYVSGADNTSAVLRVIDVVSGAERGNATLTDPRWNLEIRLTRWSPDGRTIGIKATGNWWEYWVLQGLEEAGR